MVSKASRNRAEVVVALAALRDALQPTSQQATRPAIAFSWMVRESGKMAPKAAPELGHCKVETRKMHEVVV